MYVVLIASICLVILQGDASCNLPFAKRCKSTDPKLAKCWRSALEEAHKYLVNGIPELHLPVMDPWRSKANVVYNGGKFFIQHYYMEHSGTNNFEIIDNTINLSQNLITLKLRFPQLNHVCSLSGNGTLLGFKLNKEEACNEAKADVIISTVLRGKRVIKGEKEHIDFNDIFVEVHGNYSNVLYYNFVDGTREENLLFQAAAESKSEVAFVLYNECVQKSLGLDIAAAIKNVYRDCPLADLHPLK